MTFLVKIKIKLYQFIKDQVPGKKIKFSLPLQTIDNYTKVVLIYK